MTGNRHRRAVGLLLPLTVILVLAGLLAGLRSDMPVPEPPPTPPPDTRPVAVVSLGDSTLAGEGAGDYLPGTRGEGANACHRSPHAVIQHIDLPEVSHRINLACSGTRSAHIRFDAPREAAETSQAARLGEVARRYRVAAVFVAVGANDAPAFADVVLRCAQAWMVRSGPPCSAHLTDEWPRRVAAMQPEVRAALSDIRTAMRGAGYRDDQYELVVQSYPAPLSERVAPGLQDLSGCPFRTEDLVWLRTRAVPQLSAGLRAVAQQAGARFADLARAAEGHEACTSTPEREWITRLTVDFASLREDNTTLRAVQESFHPNARGHAQIAACLSDLLRTDMREAACRVNEQDRLQAVTLPPDRE